jgi:hypothetical protein
VTHRIRRDLIGYLYDAAMPPVLSVDPGTTVVFETQDARGGAMFVNPVGQLVDLPRPPVGRGVDPGRPPEVPSVAMRDLRQASAGEPPYRMASFVARGLLTLPRLMS